MDYYHNTRLFLDLHKLDNTSSDYHNVNLFKRFFHEHPVDMRDANALVSMFARFAREVNPKSAPRPVIIFHPSLLVWLLLFSFSSLMCRFVIWFIVL